jgi:predicted phosphodiesterase
VSRLYFAVVGDTRPASVDDTAGYPTAIITKIFADMASMSPRPTFGVSTGDYMFATPGNGTAAPQLDLYLQARASFTNPMFPAMGNHECNGYTASNCGSGNTDGVTENYTAFVNQLLAPVQQTNPYYSININGTGGAWTAKFVFVAGNAWDSAQSSWLETTLAQTTTYTFIVRHEAASANTAPGVTPSEAIMAKYPYTLAIVGHTHTYEKSGAKEVIFGNGGAPLTGSGDYGFGLIQQRPDNTIQVDMIDYSTLQPDTKFEFALNPDGTAAP